MWAHLWCARIHENGCVIFCALSSPPAHSHFNWLINWDSSTYCWNIPHFPQSPLGIPWIIITTTDFNTFCHDQVMQINSKWLNSQTVRMLTVTVPLMSCLWIDCLSWIELWFPLKLHAAWPFTHNSPLLLDCTVEQEEILSVLHILKNYHSHI